MKAHDNVSVLVPIANRDRLRAQVTYQGPLIAPVKADQEAGGLKIWVGDTLIQQVPLYTAEAVAPGDLTKRSLDAVLELTTGWVRRLKF